MHYKNGREAHNGDKVVVFPDYGPPFAGILYDAVSGNDYCNGRVAVASPSDPCPNLKECLHADDAKSLCNQTLLDPEGKAKKMYEAYCSAVGGKAFNGDPLPNWETFSVDPNKTVQAKAWISAAAAV